MEFLFSDLAPRAREQLILGKLSHLLMPAQVSLLGPMYGPCGSVTEAGNPTLGEFFTAEEIDLAAKWSIRLGPHVEPLLAKEELRTYIRCVLRSLEGNSSAKVVIAVQQYNPFHYLLALLCQRLGVPLWWFGGAEIPGHHALERMGTGGNSVLAKPNRIVDNYHLSAIDRLQGFAVAEELRALQLERPRNFNQRKVTEANKEGADIFKSSTERVVVFGSNDLRTQNAEAILETNGLGPNIGSSVGLLHAVSEFATPRRPVLFKPHPLDDGSAQNEAAKIPNIKVLPQSLPFWAVPRNGTLGVTTVSNSAFLCQIAGIRVATTSTLISSSGNKVYLAQSPSQLEDFINGNGRAGLLTSAEMIARLLVFQSVRLTGGTNFWRRFKVEDFATWLRGIAEGRLLDDQDLLEIRSQR